MFTVSFRRNGIPWFSVNVLAPSARAARQAAWEWYLTLHTFDCGVHSVVSNA